MNTDRLINLYFLFVEGADMLLRTSIACGKQQNVGIKQSQKLAHNRMMNAAKAFSKNYELYYDSLYEGAFKDMNTWDDMRREANLAIRLLLLLSDRAYRSEETEKQVEEYIKNLPKGSEMDERLVDLFRMR